MKLTMRLYQKTRDGVYYVEFDILEIRKYLANGKKNSEIAALYGVDRTLIGKIKNRIIWARVA